MHRKVPGADRVLRLLPVVAYQPDLRRPNHVRLLRILRDIRGRHNLQVHVPRPHQRVGKERDILPTEEIIPVVLEEVHEPFALAVQKRHVEILVASHEPLVEMLSDNPVRTFRKTLIRHRIYKVRPSHANLIAQLHGPRIFCAVHAVRHVSVEIPVVLQQVRCNLRTCFRIDGRHRYGRGCQLAENPSPKSFLVFLEIVVNPQSEGDGNTMFRAAEE